jgi:secreted PhoX family phosphatase
MSDISQIWSANLSRRSLLQGAASAAGAATIVSVTASRAKAAKVAKQTVAYQDTPKGNLQCDGCALFESPNACKQVDGDISPKGWCKIYVPKPKSP